MAGEPLVRARHLKSMLAFADEWPGHPGARLRSHLPEADVRAILEASGIDWLDVRLDLDVTRAIHELLGPDECLRFFRRQSLSSFQGPLLRTLVDTAQRMFGLQLASWARWVPKGWALLFRDCGAWTVEAPGAKQVTLRLRALPQACSGDEIWIRTVGASLSALLDLARLEGAVTTAREPAAVRYEFTWR